MHNENEQNWQIQQKDVAPIINHSVLLATSSSVFLSHQISTSHQPRVSQQYLSLATNQPPATASRRERMIRPQKFSRGG